MRRTEWSDLERALSLHAPLRMDAPSASKAAVALVFRERSAGLELLFIHRAEHPQDPWSGQMAFPGGRAEDGDGDLGLTAVRETAEEIGIDLARDARLLGSLDETRAMSRMRALDLTVTPFVFRLEREAEHALSSEVVGVHWVALDDLLGSRLRGLLDSPYQGYALKFPGFRVGDRTIWGLTYRMFANLQALLEESAERPRHTSLTPGGG